MPRRGEKPYMAMIPDFFSISQHTAYGVLYMIDSHLLFVDQHSCD
jgi:hypothetical protein